MSRDIDKQVEKLVLILSFIALSSFLISFFYLPLVKIFQFAFSEGNNVTFNLFFSTITQGNNLKFLSFSFKQALVSTLICLILGLPASYFFAKFDFKGKKILLNLLTIPFVLPPIVVLLGFIVTYGEGGWVNDIWRTVSQSSSSLITIFGTFEGIILAHAFYNLSVIIRMTIPAWLSLDYELIEVSKTIGVSNWKIFRKITLPQVTNFIISASLLVFIYCFNSFAIVLYLGEVKYQTLEVRIYKLMKHSLKFTEGASLAIVQLFLNTLIIIIYLVFENKTRRMALGKEKGLKVEKLRFQRKNWIKNLGIVLILIFLCFILFFSFAPLIAVLIQSFTPYASGISPFWGYKTLFSAEYLPILGNSPLRLFLNTLIFAFSSTFITLILSLSIVFLLRMKFNRLRNYKQAMVENILSYAIILPMATSSITLAVGMFLQYKGTKVYLNAVWFFIILAHVLISIPFATRSILAAYNRIDVEIMNVASTLGASRVYIFKKIEFPLISKSLAVAGIFSFAISLGEFGATNFLVRGEFGTLSIGIYKLLVSQTLQLPATMASLLIILTAIAFLIIQKLGEIELKV
ncbi:MAG: ABC transporter permease [Candidatus Heimdallarchaeaceae archaeon]